MSTTETTTEAGGVIAALKKIAPLHYAASWDNVGLLIGSTDWPATKLLLTIDLTQPVMDEALEQGANFIVAYHPPIFQPFNRLTGETTKQRVALAAASSSICVYSPHTALDAAVGGVNDWLAEGVGEGDVRALTSTELLPATEECKLVTFCPEDAVEKIRTGLASVGAGQIGSYQMCSFELRGSGTFFAGEGTNPTIGEPGQIERVDEVRLEMVCARRSLPLAMMTLRQFHPYEEPPIEIYALQPRPIRDVGEGRRVTLDQPVSIRELAKRMKRRLGVEQVRVAVADDAPQQCKTIGLCAGSGGALLDQAIEQGCEVFITGEMRHHDVLASVSRGCTVMLAGHTNTERGYLSVLKQRLQEALPAVEVGISTRDADPLQVM